MLSVLACLYFGLCRSRLRARLIAWLVIEKVMCRACTSISIAVFFANSCEIQWLWPMQPRRVHPLPPPSSDTSSHSTPRGAMFSSTRAQTYSQKTYGTVQTLSTTYHLWLGVIESQTRR